MSQVDEQLYLQRQQELQRDYQIRQMLLQDQIDQQNRMDSIVVEQRLKQIREQLHEFPDLQQHYSRLLLRDQLAREQEERTFMERAQLQQQEELQRRALAQQSQAQQQASAQQAQAQAQTQNQTQTQTQTQTPSKASNVQTAHSILRDIAADSLAGNAVKRSELEKRIFAKPDEDLNPVKKRPRAGTDDSVELERKHHKKKKDKLPKKDEDSAGDDEKSADSITIRETAMKPSALALLDFATSVETVRPGGRASSSVRSQKILSKCGTLSDLLAAAASEKKSDDAVEALVDIKQHVEWSDSEREDDTERERRIAIKKGETIQLPGFSSILPQLPEEPKVAMTSKKKRKKHKGLLDDDSIEAKPNGKTKSDKKDSKQVAGDMKSSELSIIEYPYPIDTWWPSVTSIRRERKAVNESQDEDAFDEDPELVDTTAPFRANTDRIKDRFATEVSPGLLEKIPHCRIHRMLMKKRKNPSAPELVYCFQVTELYPNDVMVCCSHCGTWRHTGCGGHHKPYSVRECIDSPFTAVCDRCHEEEKILRDYPVARKRIERQRSEQVRRGLATSAAMRQASFSKHGGTYKWPLGSVSATHIGGHTRSVHSRHDKAEKQWMDMATRLGRGYGYRPKERVKVRTKELERLLVSVEDAGKKVAGWIISVSRFFR